MNKLGYLILFLAFPISYTLIHFLGLKLIGDYTFIFMICSGVALLSFMQSQNETNRKVKHLFYYAISIFNVSIILMYIIDLMFDSIFGTAKVIWTIIITTIISLCIYLFRDKS